VKLKSTPFLFAGLLICFCACVSAREQPKEMIFSVEEKIIFKGLPENIGDFCLWIPYPVNDHWQTVEDLKLTTSFERMILTDKRYGNKIVFLKSKDRRLGRNLTQVILSFKVRRKECRVSGNTIGYERAPAYFLKSGRLVPVNKEMRRLALEIVSGKKDELGRVRAIYDYIIDELTYSKDDPKICGIGNPILTLKHKKGICTDYHSLFISLVRSLGIPAKFEIGFKIPPDKIEGGLNGYHCWAKFYLKGRGWIPVDISEADKHPEKKDYYFGALDENKVHLTTGRDIRLKYAKDNQPLNFFVYPYAELNGRRFDNIEIKVSFKE